MIALRGKGNCLPLPTSMKKEQKAKKIEKLKRTKNERRRSNLQIFKKKDLKKRKKKNKTYIHGYKNGEEKWNDKKKEKETVLTIDFKMKKRIRWRRWGKKKRKDAAFFDPDSFCFLLLVCTHYDLSQFIVLSMKYCNKNTVNYS